jgi:hypothetical protein
MIELKATHVRCVGFDEGGTELFESRIWCKEREKREKGEQETSDLGSEKIEVIRVAHHRFSPCLSIVFDRPYFDR